MRNKETLSTLEAQYRDARENIERADALMRENIKIVNGIRPIIVKQWLEAKHPNVKFTVKANDTRDTRGHYSMDFDITYAIAGSQVSLDQSKITQEVKEYLASIATPLFDKYA
jgi:hypothetical protein